MRGEGLGIPSGVREVADEWDEHREVRKMNAPRAKSAAERVAAIKRQLSTMNDDALLLRKESDNMGGELKQLTVELVRASFVRPFRRVELTFSFTCTQSDIQKMITQNELELNRLKRQHVQSPERLRANIQEMSASVQKDQENVRTLEHRERQHQAKLSALTKYEQVCFPSRYPFSSSRLMPFPP